ncbi:MAG: hypothetical protein HY866_21090 [Chloroflexi bacterium]|nr:hypothetical protein [Chloroflexota bacterium]
MSAETREENDMRISELLKKFEFHDASIDTIVYSQNERTLTFEVDLGELEEDQTGCLVFHGIEYLASTLPLETIQWNQGLYADIVAMKPYPKLDNESSAGVCASLEMRHYTTLYHSALVIEFSAACAEWKPSKNH